MTSSISSSLYRRTDALGVEHPVADPAARIVSLVPSITELLFALGLGDQVVGRTPYCVNPAEQIRQVPSVGGTKKIKHRVMRALNATHVILNIDENPREMAETLAEYVPNRIVTHPMEPLDNVHLFRLLGGIFRREAEAEVLCRRFEQALARVGDQAWPKRDVLYLIWRKPWMTVARDTYISRTLALFGWNTVPAIAEQRYPALEINHDVLEAVDWVLFSTEPYRFTPDHLPEFAERYGCPPTKLKLIDGEMTSWYGNRALLGLDYLCRFVATST